MSEERARGGAPLDPEEAALLSALRARGLVELAEMALYSLGDSVGNAAAALREMQAPPGSCPNCHRAAFDCGRFAAEVLGREPESRHVAACEREARLVQR